MTDRREFLQAGAALSALPLAGGAAEASTGAARPPEPVALYKVIFDRRFAEGRTFGAEAERLGASVHAIDGDVTDLWYRDLHARWRAGPAPIAGLTAQGALFCLERWAWEAGMRVVFRADHRRSETGAASHVLSAPPGGGWLAGHLEGAGAGFATEAARIVTRWPKGRHQVVAAAGLSYEPPEPEPLVSWVIAPLQKA